MPFLPPNQQRQSTEGNQYITENFLIYLRLPVRWDNRSKMWFKTLVLVAQITFWYQTKV